MGAYGAVKKWNHRCSHTYVQRNFGHTAILRITACVILLPFLKTPLNATLLRQLPPIAMSSEENQFNVQGYNIVTILKRLEAATSRLEDITIFQEEATRQHLPKPVTGASQAAIDAPKSAPEPAEVPRLVQAFHTLIAEVIEPLEAQSAAIGDVLGEAAGLLKAAFLAQAEALLVVARSAKPELTDPAFAALLEPINKHIAAITELKDKNRRLPLFNHLNTVAEGAPVLGWIVTQTPVSFVPEFKDLAQFWLNKVLKEHKDGDAAHSAWVKAFLGIFEPLRAYVKEFHATGPSWAPKGIPLADALASTSSESTPSVSAPPPPAAGGPPPPPPPPPANLFEENSAPSGGMGAVFADLNKGENITASLKKVDKSEMTHKNPELRGQAPLSKKPAPPKKPSSLSSATPKQKPARKELVDGLKWFIENYTDADVSGPIIIEVEKHHSVFVNKTSGVTVQIKGKANTISISETRNTGIVVDTLISSIDVIKSYKFGVQVIGVVPLISVDKSDEGSIYLSQESVDAGTQVFSSSTTALNINVPDAANEGDFAELAVPEQFVHSVKGGKLVSEVVEHVG